METALEFAKNNFMDVESGQSFELGGLSKLDQTQVLRVMKAFAKIHVQAALLAVNGNVRLVQSSSEEVNEKGITPFITADDNTLWIIDKESILNAYSLDNIK